MRGIQSWNLARALGVVGVLVASLLSAPAGAHEPSGRIIARDVLTPAVTDGHGVTALFSRPGMLRVIDASKRESFEVDVTAGCLQAPTTVVAVGGGQVVFNCTVEDSGTDRHDVPRLLDISTRTVHVPPGADQAIAAAETEPLGYGYASAIGTYGLLIKTPYYHGGDPSVVLDWHTGASFYSPPNPTQIRDLDKPSMITSLCAPLQLMPSDEPGPIDTVPFDPYLYEPPFGVIYGTQTSLSIQRCGSARKLVLQPTQDGAMEATDIELAAGFVSWIVGDAGGSLYAYLPACHVRLAWRDVPWVDGNYNLTQHLDGAMLVARPRDPENVWPPAGPWTIWRIPIAGACTRTARALTAQVFAGGSRAQAAWSSGSVRDVPSGADATLLGMPRAPIPRLQARVGAHLGILLGTPSRRLRWRVGGGPWHSASGHAKTWSLRVPPSRTSHTLAIEAAFTRGGSARFAITLTATTG